MKLTITEVKEFYNNIKDPGEISVGYERSYYKMLEWLTAPYAKNGLGLPEGYAIKLLALTAYQIKIEALELDKAWKIDRYLKQKASEFNDELHSNRQEALEKTIVHKIEDVIYDPWFATKARKHQKDVKKLKKQEKKQLKREGKRLKKAKKK